MRASSRSPDLFRVTVLGMRPSPQRDQGFAEYRDAERRAKEDTRRTICAHDIYLGTRLVATVTASSFAGKISVDMTAFGSRFA
ncbi:hypothetical protein AD945_17495 [Gluconobacter albidus]|uniref:Uncharacterized protein n=1 Tax=Gluconobacter albidus TaxID=318683 RepID=A0A149TEK9_9PROT|nr:hypothetical protein [Gluconobacter albidus]KXV45942.1 hypothetical protein AD945_17495 [Gluconobacter albidus]